MCVHGNMDIKNYLFYTMAVCVCVCLCACWWTWELLSNSIVHCLETNNENKYIIINNSRWGSRAENVMKDSTHPRYHLFELLPTVQRCSSTSLKTKCLVDSFYPWALHKMNAAARWNFQRILNILFFLWCMFVCVCVCGFLFVWFLLLLCVTEPGNYCSIPFCIAQ